MSTPGVRLGGGGKGVSLLNAGAVMPFCHGARAGTQQLNECDIMECLKVTKEVSLTGRKGAKPCWEPWLCSQEVSLG